MTNMQKTTMNKDLSEFLDSLHAKGIGKTRMETEFLWKSCCDHALDWMVNKQRPVDMWFIRLHCSPLRADWMLDVYRYVLRILNCQMSSPHTPQGTEYVRKQFEKRMLSGRVLAMDGDYIRRFVEVEHTSMWRRLIKSVEKQRWEALNPVRYAEYVFATLYKTLPWNKRRFSNWIALCSDPAGKTMRRLRELRPRLFPTRAPFPFSISGYRLTPGFNLLRISDGEKADFPYRYAADTYKKNGSLSNLSGLRTEAENMRRDENVQGSSDKPT